MCIFVTFSNVSLNNDNTSPLRSVHDVMLQVSCVVFVGRKSIFQSDVLLGATQQNGIARYCLNVAYLNNFETIMMARLYLNVKGDFVYALYL